MRNRPAPGSLRLASVALAIVSSTCGCPREVNKPRVDEGPAFAFVGVNVVPMDGERILPDQTVVVRAGVIAAIGPRTEIAVPPDVSSIDGGGNFLMPGLADMHVHTWDTDDFVLFLANGVTTVRNMFGGPIHLEWRERIESGGLLGPTIYTAGPIIDGDPPIWPGSTVLVDPADAEQVVLDQARAGYDFLKVYERLTPEVYDALVDAAREHGMRVMGHVPAAVDLSHAIASRQRSVEHLDGWAEEAQARDSPLLGQVTWTNESAAWKVVDPSKIEDLARSAARAGTWNCPTLIVYQKWVAPAETTHALAAPVLKYVPPATLSFWRPENNYLASFTQERIDSVRAADQDRKRAVGLLHRAGAGILLGTDMGNPFVVAGYSVHEELRNLVDAGLSPYEALRAGTAGASEFMGAGEEWGTVAVGRRADLILLAANPLLDVGHASHPLGVMVRGRWLPESELRAQLDALEAKYAR